MKIFRRDGSFLVEPTVTLTITCPSCGQRLMFGVKACRFCREPIDEEYAVQSAVYSAIVTQACSLANIIRTGKPAVIMLIAVGVIAYLLGFKWLYAVADFPISVLYCVAVVRWRYRYGELELRDAEFTQTQKEMKWYLHLWLGFVAAEVLIMCVW
jgi:hypothetical protein